MTVWRMQRTGWSGLASAEDLRAGLINANPSPDQLQPNEAVERSRRMHRNDLENIPAFLAIGLIFVTIDPPRLATLVLLYGFVIARLCHSVAYATAQSHEVRATFYTLGSVAVVVMAFWVLAALAI
jgi:uncharacterized MAPEG superfamily protein